LILALAACARPPDGGTVEADLVAAGTAETGAPVACGPTALERGEPRCDQGVLELLAYTTGCADAVALDLWDAGLRHERHPLDRVTVAAADGATWSLGAVLAGVAPADWSPGSASAVRCDALDELTFAIAVEVAGEPVHCEAWGPRADEASTLPGAACAP
jgi:hypothetical protein